MAAGSNLLIFNIGKMKKILYILTAIAALLFASSCEKESGVLNQLAGDWHCTMVESGVTQDVYLSLGADGQFEMYQKTGDGPYWYSTGKYTLDAEAMVLSGMYSDKYPWKYSYKVAVSASSLEMTAVENEAYVVSYSKETIPAEVRAKSLPLTKSESAELFL